MNNHGNSGWRKPEQWAGVRAGEAQVWRLDARAAAHELWRELEPEEIARARRIRASVARDEFVAGRAALRLLLGWELDCASKRIRLGVAQEGGAQEKPMLVGGGIDFGGMEFNVAHAGGVVLIALSRAGAVGVDVEREDRDVEALEIARASFHAEEIALIEQAEANEQAGTFYRVWTRKEAVVKADGRGLLVGLNGFSVCRKEDDLDETKVQLAGNAGFNAPSHLEQKCYWVRDLGLSGGWVGSVAFARAGVAVSLNEFRGFSARGGEQGVAMRAAGLSLAERGPDEVTT